MPKRAGFVNLLVIILFLCLILIAGFGIAWIELLSSETKKDFAERFGFLQEQVLEQKEIEEEQAEKSDLTGTYWWVVYDTPFCDSRRRDPKLKKDLGEIGAVSIFWTKGRAGEEMEGSLFTEQTKRFRGSYDGRRLDFVDEEFLSKPIIPVTVSAEVSADYKSLKGTYRAQADLEGGGTYPGCPLDGSLSGPVTGKVCREIYDEECRR